MRCFIWPSMKLGNSPLDQTLQFVFGVSTLSKSIMYDSKKRQVRKRIKEPHALFN